jgi:hypothetical protein
MPEGTVKKYVAERAYDFIGRMPAARICFSTSRRFRSAPFPRSTCA